MSSEWDKEDGRRSQSQITQGRAAAHTALTSGMSIGSNVQSVSLKSSRGPSCRQAISTMFGAS